MHRVITYVAVAIGAALCTYLAIERLTGGATGEATRTADVVGEGMANAIDATTIEIPARVAELNKMAIAVAKMPTRERELVLRGSLAIDSGKLVHVHTRFPGRIVEVGTIEDADAPSTSGEPRRRPLGFMDRVTKGQQMAVLWSKDLGEKKSELVDALARLHLDQQALSRMEDLTQRGAISEKNLRDAQRQVQTGEIAVSKAERTLRSWEVSEEEIAHVRAEAGRIGKDLQESPQQDAEWARVEITSPINGTIVEKNFSMSDLVDTDADLFKVADLSVLNVWLHAYEEDLPYLQRLPKPIPVAIRLPANPEIGVLPGAVERIGDIIDPNEHMALLIGHVENPHGELRAGQFVTATVGLAPEEGVVEIPTRSLVEDGTESLVFVQPDSAVYRFKPRRVSVARRFFDIVQVRSHLSPEQKVRGLEELHEGERVAASETVQLKAALRQKQLSSTNNQSMPTSAGTP